MLAIWQMCLRPVHQGSGSQQSSSPASGVADRNQPDRWTDGREPKHRNKSKSETGTNLLTGMQPDATIMNELLILILHLNEMLAIWQMCLRSVHQGSGSQQSSSPASGVADRNQPDRWTDGREPKHRNKSKSETGTNLLTGMQPDATIMN